MIDVKQLITIHWMTSFSPPRGILLKSHRTTREVSQNAISGAGEENVLTKRAYATHHMQSGSLTDKLCCTPHGETARPCRHKMDMRI